MTLVLTLYRRGGQMSSLRTFYSIVGPLLLVVALTGCATAPPYNPFQISEERFRTTVKRIALAPIVVPLELGISESTKLRFDSLIEAKLKDAGFDTFPAKNWGEVMERILLEVGGVFDPRTGSPDETKVKTVLARTGNEIRGRFQFDAVLLPRVHVVKADWGSAWANWDGVREALASGLGTLGAPNARGTIPALSLVVSVGGPDPDAPALYRQRAGIQVLQKLTPFPERIFGKMFVPVPQDELLTNDERNRAAVEIALGPLVKKP